MRFKYALYLILTVPLISFGQQGKMISEIKNHKQGIALWWAGHNSWLIKSEDILIATDLWLENGYRFSPSPVTPEEVAEELDISFVTHAHDDHFNKHTTSVLLKKSKCIFVMPESCLSKARELEIPVERIRIAKPRESMEVNGVKVEAVRAIHGNANFAIYYEANLQDCGYLITLNGTTFLQPGDTYLLEDHLFLKHVDVLFFSPTEHNMYIDPSVILINTLNPDFIFPQHHSTINYKEADRFWAKGYPDEVKLRLGNDMRDKYHILKPGDKFVIQ
jgi:L-ascorbate metabolism protein UlaG (beta-lactamase superfamily)